MRKTPVFLGELQFVKPFGGVEKHAPFSYH